MQGEAVGRVVALWRYPVKSMAGEALSEAQVSWHGIAGDRRWAFVRDGTARNGFPWLSIRERAEMCHYHPFFVDPAKPDKSATQVRAPDGREFDVADPALAAELHPEGARLIKLDRGCFDSFPLSLITTSSIARIGEWVGATLDPRRFRPNLLVETTDGAPFQEDAWLGRVLRIGEISLRIDKRDGRCVITTIDPDTLERNPEVLRTIAREREGKLGVYASTVERGRVAVGDNVYLV